MDITLCHASAALPACATCVRNVSKHTKCEPNDWQSYCDPHPENGKCPMYWPEREKGK